MTLSWIAFHAEHGDRISEVQKSVQVPTKMRNDYAFVVPFPNRVARAGLSRLCSHVSWHAPFPQMKVSEPLTFQRLLQIAFAQFGSIHADWIVPDVEYALHTGTYERIEQLLRRPTFIPNREKVCPIRGARFIPQRLTFRASASGFGGEFEWTLYQDAFPSTANGLCRRSPDV